MPDQKFAVHQEHIGFTLRPAGEAAALPAAADVLAADIQGLGARLGQLSLEQLLAQAGGFAAKQPELVRDRLKARLAELGFDPVGNTPAEFSALVLAEQRKWVKLIQAAGIKPE
jgi:hypothetical protein